MGMTITEKILAAHAGRDKVEPGDLINAKVDLVLGNDITSPVAIREFKKIGVKKVFDQERIALVPDHFTPNKDIASATQAKMVRDFAEEYGIVNYFEVGQMGIEHCLLPEKGLVGPGDVVIGADSHTCTYGALGAFATGVGSTDMAAAMALGETWFKVPETIRFTINGNRQPWVSGKDFILYIIGKIGVDGALYSSMEFDGSAIADLSMDSRLAMANMAIEAGGKNGIFTPDAKTWEFVKTSGSNRTWQAYHSDEDARYREVFNIDAAEIEPQVSFPHLPENARGLSQVGEVVIDQVVIGSCTNGRMEDLRIAADILKGHKVAKGVRLIVLPGTQKIVAQAIAEGVYQTLLEAGAAISTPTCGCCLGGHMGILAAKERCVATTNRNFVGRMGHVESEVYLAGPAIAAASAITGKISGPEEVK
jgi:3-isopropylmalate/(R)-2-methylmalate dehydratase large subunit